MSEDLTYYRTQLILDVLKPIPETRFESVVDFGCGDGSNLRSVAEIIGAKRAKGVDLSVSDVQSGPVVLHRGNLLDYSSDEQYQLVISNQVFEHIYDPWLPRYFNTLKASCAPGGIILISTPNRWRPKNLFRFLTFRRPYMMQPNTGLPPEQHLGHHRECSYRELRSILSEYFQAPEWNFTIVRTIPRLLESRARWLANVFVYFVLWIFWRPSFVSASQDHYVVIRRTPA
jgi:SAM-dependent methyltransferase